MSPIGMEAWGWENFLYSVSHELFEKISGSNSYFLIPFLYDGGDESVGTTM